MYLKHVFGLNGMEEILGKLNLFFKYIYIRIILKHQITNEIEENLKIDQSLNLNTWNEVEEILGLTSLCL